MQQGSTACKDLVQPVKPKLGIQPRFSPRQWCPAPSLTYTVEFENEGEGIAFGVYFVDTLDKDLDISTLEIGPVINSSGHQIARPGVFDPAVRTITWFVGEVGPGQGGHAEVCVRVNSSAPRATEMINYATVYFPSVPEITPTNGVVSEVGTCVYLPVSAH